MAVKLAVIYYSSTGTTYALARAIEEGAQGAGAEVRFRKVHELAPEKVIASKPEWAAHLEETKDVEEASNDDLTWADAIILGTPTRYGLPTAQLKQFLDQTGGLWAKGALANKVCSSFTVTNRTLATTNVELRETRLRLASETEAERSRIARDLHDQTLADLRHLLVLTDQLPPPASDEHAPNPAVLRKEIEAISSEIRHICEDLSPSVLENIGFLPALEWALADAVAHLPSAEKFTYEFICDPELEERLRLLPIEQIQLYRIVQEALNNICRHAQARRVQLFVRVEQQHELVIEIADDGVGFAGLPLNRHGHGLANIRSRANLIGAQIAWHDVQPGCRFVTRKAGAVAVQ